MARFSTACLTAALLLVAGVDAFAPPAVSSAATAASGSTCTYATSLFAAGPRTLYDKIWDDHVVTEDDSSALIYIDRHLVHEVRAVPCHDSVGTVIICLFVCGRTCGTGYTKFN